LAADRERGGGVSAINARDTLGTHDVVFVTLDTLRVDAAERAFEQGRTPALATLCPGGWERRHTSGSFTYAAHHAFFAGFLPTPIAPGTHARHFAARFAGSETTASTTLVFDHATIVEGYAAAGYHTVCIGGVGFFNRRSALGRVLPDLFAESHWEPSFGVTDPDSTRHQVDRIEQVVRTAGPGPLFVFLNVSALHHPNCHYVRGATKDDRGSHAAALTYVDGQLDRLWRAITRRGRPCLAIVCSDHGTAYGEDGHTGHRVAHESVWTVPYAHFVVRHA
jgi:arylsulfatase A-like enzyme